LISAFSFIAGKCVSAILSSPELLLGSPSYPLVDDEGGFFFGLCQYACTGPVVIVRGATSRRSSPSRLHLVASFPVSELLPFLNCEGGRSPPPFPPAPGSFVPTLRYVPSRSLRVFGFIPYCPLQPLGLPARPPTLKEDSA